MQDFKCDWNVAEAIDGSKTYGFIYMKIMKHKYERASKRFVWFVIDIKEEDDNTSKAKKNTKAQDAHIQISLWLPIYVAITQHWSLSAALNYLRAYHKTLGQIYIAPIPSFLMDPWLSGLYHNVLKRNFDKPLIGERYPY